MGAKDILLAAAVAGTLLMGLNPAFPHDWVQTSAPGTNWISIASSADGTKLVASASGPIYTSTNSAETWSATSAPTLSWNTVASSADGTVLVDGDYLGLWVSTDSGSSWRAGAPVPLAWVYATCSADGANVVASTFGGIQTAYLLTSTNSGATWATRKYFDFKSWRCVASSADETKLFAGTAVV